MTNAVRSIQTQRLMTIGALGLMALMISEPSFAGTGGDAFTDVWDTLKDWTQGTLGRIVAGAMVLVGIVGGIARQSLMAFALGIGGGMGLYNTPTVVESVMSATLPVVASTQEVIGTTIPAISAVLLGTLTIKNAQAARFLTAWASSHPVPDYHDGVSVNRFPIHLA